MPNRNTSGGKKLASAVLVLIMLLAAFLTYLPHLHYGFPLLVDEWYHIDVAQHIALTGQLPALDPILNRFAFPDVEKGYHVLLAGIYLLFHPNIMQWTYLPILFAVVSILSVFYFVSKLYGPKEALVASFLIALLPTTLASGGPVFLIPTNLSLIFIPLGLLFAFELTKIKKIYNYIGLFLVLTFLLYSHPPGAMALLLILAFYIILNFISMKKPSMGKAKWILVTAVAAAIASIPNFVGYIETHNGLIGAISFNFFVYLNQIPLVYGVIPALFFIFGSYLLFQNGKKEGLSMLLASLVLIIMVVLFANFGINFLIPYQRIYIPLFLLMSIIASVGYIKMLLADKKVRIRNLGVALLIIALATTSYAAIMRDISTPYYHIINNTDYHNFIWIKNNLNNSATVLLDPWKARAFGPVTNMYVYSVYPFGPNATYMQLVNNTYAFFAGNCTDTQFLRSNNISIIYAPTPCRNLNLTLVNNYTYVFGPKAKWAKTLNTP